MATDGNPAKRRAEGTAGYDNPVLSGMTMMTAWHVDSCHLRCRFSLRLHVHLDIYLFPMASPVLCFYSVLLRCCLHIFTAVSLALLPPHPQHCQSTCRPWAMIGRPCGLTVLLELASEERTRSVPGPSTKRINNPNNTLNKATMPRDPHVV